MTFDDLVAGEAVFVDANTLVYHCTLDPIHATGCTSLLNRIGNRIGRAKRFDGSI